MYQQHYFRIIYPEFYAISSDTINHRIICHLCGIESQRILWRKRKMIWLEILTGAFICVAILDIFYWKEANQNAKRQLHQSSGTRSFNAHR